MKGQNDVRIWNNVTFIMNNISDCEINFYENNYTKSLLDLTYYYSGIENCPANHYWMGVRNHYLIHFVLSGCGECTFDDSKFNIKKGQAFLVRPGQRVHYKADSVTPWKYCWIAFTGMKASSLLDKTAFANSKFIADFNNTGQVEDIIYKLTEIQANQENRYFMQMSCLCEVLSNLEMNKSQNKNIHGIKGHHLEVAIKFIDRNYSRHITVDIIADHVGINRKYLSSIFSSLLNTTTQQYLINKRMNQASILLSDLNLSIKEIAHSVGYYDALLFSKMFKNKFGISPKGFRSRSVD